MAKNDFYTVRSKQSDLTLTLVQPFSISDFDKKFVDETLALGQVPIYSLRSGKLTAITRAKTKQDAVDQLDFLANHTEQQYFDLYDPDEVFGVEKKNFYSVNEAAEKTGLAEDTIRKRIKRGEINALRVGKRAFVIPAKAMENLELKKKAGRKKAIKTVTCPNCSCKINVD